MKVNKKTNGKMTLEKLATMVASGFTEVGQKLEVMDQKIDGVEKRLDQKIDYRFDTLTNRIDGLVETKATRQEHKDLQTRVTRIEKKLEIAK